MTALPTTNPIFVRLTRNAKPPSLRTCLWLAFGLGLTTLAFMSWTMLYHPIPPFVQVGLLLMLLSAALTFLLPIPIGIIAATITARDVQGEEYQLLRLTNLSPRTIVWGYIGTALHRLRLLLALMIGTMPSLVMGILLLEIMIDSVFASISTCLDGPCSPQLLSAETANSLYWGTYTWLVVALTLWGVNLLGAALGVWLSLAWRKAAPAVTTAAFTTLVAEIGIGVLLMLFGSDYTEPAAALLRLLPLAAVPYLMGLGIAGLARLQAAKERSIG